MSLGVDDIAGLAWDKGDGLLPAVVQDAATGAVLMLACLLAGCGESQPPAMREVEVRPLPVLDATTLALDDSGRVWLGEDGRMVVVVGAVVDAVHPTPSGDPPRMVEQLEGRVYLEAGDSVLVVPRPDTLGIRGDMGRAVLAGDPRGRFLLQGAYSGAVLAHDVDTLEPLWGWGAIGAATTGLALSRIGDRVYQAVTDDEEGSRLLIRDLQTGRTLEEFALSGPMSALVVAPSGRLYGVEGERMDVVSFDPGPGGVVEVWRQRVAAEEGAEAHMAVAGGRIVVWGGGVRWGLLMLDAETGEVVRRAGEAPIDAAVDPAGAIWALYPGELRRLE